jgi:hypothetical protein
MWTTGIFTSIIPIHLHVLVYSAQRDWFPDEIIADALSGDTCIKALFSEHIQNISHLQILN